MRKILYTLALALAFNIAAFAQCKLVVNPLTGSLTCGGGSGAANTPPYVMNFLSTDTALTVLASTHGQSTKPVVLGCYLNNSGTLTRFFHKAETYNTTGDITVSLSTNAIGTAGYCLIGGTGTGGGGGTGSGTVTSVDVFLPSLFSKTGGPITGSGSINFSLAAQAAGLVLAGPLSGGNAAPTFRALSSSDIPALNYENPLTFSSPLIRAVNTISLGTVPVSNGGTNLTSLTQYALLYASTSGAFGQIPIGPAGQCLVVNGTANGYGYQSCTGVAPYAANFLSTDTSITVTATTHNQGTKPFLAGCWTVATGTATKFEPKNFTYNTTSGDATVTLSTNAIGTGGLCLIAGAQGGGGTGGGTGTVTSVALTMPSGFSVTGSPVTGSGTLAVTTSLSGVLVASGGAINTVTGTGTNCVHVDGTSAACSTGGSSGTVTNLDASINGTSGLPILSSSTATDIKTGTKTGNTNNVATADTNAKTTGDIAKWDVGGNLTDGGTVKTAICTLVRTSGTAVTVASSATSSIPCVIAQSFSSPVYLSAPFTVGVPGTGATSGTVWAGVDGPSGNPIVYQSQSGIGATCSMAGCSVVTATNPPASFVYFGSWTVTNNVFDAAGGSNLVSEVAQGTYINPGRGITVDYAHNQATVAVDSTVATKITGTASLTFTSVANAACQDQTMAVTGATTGQAVAPIWPATFTAGWQANVWVSSANTLTVRACNFTGATATLTGTFGGTVLF